MSDTNQTNIRKDLAGRNISVTRHFNGSPNDVWDAWTQPQILDQWWAPKPWRTETKSMDFRTGGTWQYAMVGPDGTRHWCRVDYTEITPITSFAGNDCFCDEQGNADTNFPRMTWSNTFTPAGDGTDVHVRIVFPSQADLEKIVEMGFEAGFTAALTNLDAYLSTRFKMRAEMKTSNQPRVTTYLNFPGNTEEAFNFYRQVFRAEFTGRGLQRFEDVALPEGIPPMSEADKKLIIHAELTILGGHVLMATDAPESMGFKLQTGNNMHICLEPATREETERLFNELSAGGKVTMPLADMFFGAYFAEFTDKYGINWMLNHQNAQA